MKTKDLTPILIGAGLMFVADKAGVLNKIGLGSYKKKGQPIKNYNYFYDNRPIPKSHFLQEVPENWESEVINGEYSFGYYRASLIEEEL